MLMAFSLTAPNHYLKQCWLHQVHPVFTKSHRHQTLLMFCKMSDDLFKTIRHIVRSSQNFSVNNQIAMSGDFVQNVWWFASNQETYLMIKKTFCKHCSPQGNVAEIAQGIYRIYEFEKYQFETTATSPRGQCRTSYLDSIEKMVHLFTNRCIEQAQ